MDTNVWISALVFGGRPRKVFEQIVQDGHVLIISEAILTEIRRILHTKLSDYVQDFEDLLIGLQLRITLVELGSVTIDICRDPDDNRVFETAVIGRAEVIVSGDKDLLVLNEYRRIQIISPAMH